jgi:imidazolonepropionase-like amidohydrolase
MTAVLTVITLLALCSSVLHPNDVGAQSSEQSPASAPETETGKFRLYKLQQPIGEEVYEIKREGQSVVLSTKFKLSFLGDEVPLEATLRARPDLTPESFEIKGRTSTRSDIEAAVEIKGTTATVREGKASKQATVPARFFTISGYAPMAVQMMLFRYRERHNIKGALKTFPEGVVTFEHRGRDTAQFGGREVLLDRYSVEGVTWGRESLWFDVHKNLVAFVGGDAELDRFEAIREGYESLMPLFVKRSVEDGISDLAELKSSIKPLHNNLMAIVGATLIDGTGKRPVADSVVVIENGRIVAVGARSAVKIPKGAAIFDARGRYLLPGLWDMHSHFEQVEWAAATLAAGVTTARDVGNEFELVTAMRDAIKEGRALGPRMMLAGVIDGPGDGALGVVTADTPESARAAVNLYKRAGFEEIKIYQSLKPELVSVITAEAHKLGMSVTGHVPTGMNAIQAVEAGMDQINHINFVTRVMRPKHFRAPQTGPIPPIDLETGEAKQAIEFFKTHGTVIDPTLARGELNLHPRETPFTTFEPSMTKVPRELFAPLNNTGLPPDVTARISAVVKQAINITGVLHRAGIPIVAGSDLVVPGHSIYRELELYVEGGMTPLEAIQSATTVPAHVMKVDKEVGTIELGKRADLIIVDGNPLASISNIRKVRYVVTGGQMYDCAALWRSVGFRP